MLTNQMDTIVEFSGPVMWTTVPLEALGGVLPPVGAVIRLSGWFLRVTAVEIDYMTTPTHVQVTAEEAT